MQMDQLCGCKGEGVAEGEEGRGGIELNKASALNETRNCKKLN